MAHIAMNTGIGEALDQAGSALEGARKAAGDLAYIAERAGMRELSREMQDIDGELGVLCSRYAVLHGEAAARLRG